MSYQDEKNKNFSKYCAEGKVELVRKWINNPNVDINYNANGPLRNAVRYNHIDIVRYLISHSKLDTNYDRPRGELKGGIVDANGGAIGCMINPFTIAMANKNFDILDIFIKKSNHPFKVNRIANLDVLIEMNDNELNEYFIGIPGFIEYVVSAGNDYIGIISQEAKDIFLF